MAMKGMDVELVTEFGNRMRGEVTERIRDLRESVARTGRNLQWEGSDAQQFMEHDIGALAIEIDRLAEQVTEFGQLAIDNATVQAEISARL